LAAPWAGSIEEALRFLPLDNIEEALRFLPLDWEKDDDFIMEEFWRNISPRGRRGLLVWKTHGAKPFIPAS